VLVKELLKTKGRDPITIVATASLLEAMKKLVENKISCLPVVKSGDKLEGIVSDRDIFKAVHEDHAGFKHRKVADIMTTDLVIGVADDDVQYIGGVMTNNRVRHIPILENDRLIGLVSVGDVVKVQIESMQVENRYLRTYIDGSYPA